MSVLLLTGASQGWANTLVEFDYGARGKVLVDLFTEVTPQSVTTFLGYVNEGRYTDTVIHRTSTIPQLRLIQGGGFNDQLQSITASTSFLREYHLDNSRGTLGSARTSDPTNFSSQWYFNTIDNSAVLAPINNSGFAVFGWVVGPGMSTIDNIYNVPTFNFSGLNPALPTLPVANYTAADYANGVDPRPNLVVLEGISIVNVHPSFQNPFDRFDVNNDGLVSAQDEFALQNFLIVHGPRSVDEIVVGTRYLYLDVNGDGQVSQLDLVPEPSGIALAFVGMAALAALSLRRRRKNSA